MENNLGINNFWLIIQGPLTYYDEVRPSYSGFDNVIWSTWKNEEKKIKNEKHKVLSSYPLFTGKQNINYQVKSTLAGLKYAKNLGAKYVFKIRSDIAFSDLKLLISKLKFDDTLYFPAYHLREEGYFIDYFMFGPIDKMIKLWSIPTKFRFLNTKYPEYYIKKSYFKHFKDEKVRYIIPILEANNMNYMWFKHPENFSEILEDKVNFVYDKYQRD
ncbi:hypothetical protein IKQ26_10335 [bacterium]|nr:hypothetical protein [bacterium]